MNIDVSSVNESNFIFIVALFLIFSAISLIAWLLKAQSKNNETLIKQSYTEMKSQISNLDNKVDQLSKNLNYNETTNGVQEERLRRLEKDVDDLKRNK